MSLRTCGACGERHTDDAGHQCGSAAAIVAGLRRPIPYPEQALHVLEILGQWTARGWWYEATRHDLLPPDTSFVVYYTNPEQLDSDGADGILQSRGVDHFDALCQATTVMQVLLEEHPEKI